MNRLSPWLMMLGAAALAAVAMLEGSLGMGIRQSAGWMAARILEPVPGIGSWLVGWSKTAERSASADAPWLAILFWTGLLLLALSYLLSKWADRRMLAKSSSFWHDFSR